MRTILCILLVTLSTTCTHSQVLISLLFGEKLNSPGLEFGLEGGYNWSWISEFEGKRPLATFNLGFYFDVKLKNQYGLYTGVLIRSKLGQDNLTDADLLKLGIVKDAESGDYSQVADYFIVPVLLKYKFKNYMYAELGPQLAWNNKAYIEFNSRIDGNTARIRVNNDEQINKIDAGIVAGFGYTLLKGKGMTIGIKYYYGFLDVYRDISGLRNNALFLKLNIPIGAAEVKKE